MTISLSREIINLMMQSQKMIKQEFGVRIDLDDEQAIARFLAYANQSSSDLLKSCTQQLLDQLIPNPAKKETPVDKASSKIRYYRGQPVKEPLTPTIKDNDDASSKPKKNIIYRGQKITL